MKIITTSPQIPGELALFGQFVPGLDLTPIENMLKGVTISGQIAASKQVQTPEGASTVTIELDITAK